MINFFVIKQKVIRKQLEFLQINEPTGRSKYVTW